MVNMDNIFMVPSSHESILFHRKLHSEIEMSHLNSGGVWFAGDELALGVKHKVEFDRLTNLSCSKNVSSAEM